VVHGLSAAETGRATGLTEEQVHSQVSYARKRLRELLVEPAERSVIAGGRR
jgi:DNA-directed RNA polymerase specialized sigma24 family protein